MNPRLTQAGRRRKILLRAVPLALLAAISFGVGLWIASGSDEVDAAERFAEAWQDDDYSGMYAELSKTAKAETSEQDFERAYESAREISTLQSITAGEARGPIEQNGSDVVAIQVTAETDSFGTVAGELAVPVADGGVAWNPGLVFPGLKPGEVLDRATKAPERAPILYADGSPLAEGPADARTTNGAGGIVAGEVGEPSAERIKELLQEGFPEGMPAGTTGLELAFDEMLAGTPGGKLLAVSEGGKRVIAKRKPQPGQPLRTTIDSKIQQLASDALGGQFGGVAVLDAKSGDVRGLAGIAFSAPQPPGSTMKIVTASAALEDGVAELDSEYPVETSTVVGGREIANAHDESCGGNLVTSFAKSCNTVFAPMGAELGADRFVDIAEKYGFNSPPPLYEEEALERIDPPASTTGKIESDLELGVSAIGQGEVLATPLQMASVAQTIANNGVRSPTSLVEPKKLSADAKKVDVVSSDTADEMRKLMVEVVKSGTGAAAAIPQAQVAGKTGTAELGTSSSESTDPDAEPEQDVDAWFSAFAPADDPKLAVAAMVVNADGDGGVVAAPIVQQILSGAL